MATAELLFRINAQAGDFKATMAQVRSELTQTGQTQTTVAKGELSTRQQLAAAASLQRQRSAALIGEWKRTERAAADLARGVGPVKDNLQKVTDIMQTLGGASASLQGPLGGVAGRLRSLGSLATEAGGGLGVVGVAAGGAVVAIAALTVGAIALSKSFFDLIVSTAQWEGKLYDLSQQTGVSVETLSTLSALAEDTGGSIESISQSLVIFQGNLDEAQDSASKTGKQFAELGISTNNTEQAFRDALKALAAMPEGFKQTNDAAELFGRRGGKQVLAILKESHGDIDTTTEKLRALNSLVTGPVAKGADVLNDQLNATRRQFQGLTAQIVNESMPLIVSALRDLSRILSENREAFTLLGQAIGLLIQGNLRLIAPAVTIASLAFDGHRRALAPVIEMYQQFAAVLQIVSGLLPSVDPNAIPALSTTAPFSGAATQSASASILDATTRKKGTGSGKGGGKSARDTALQDAIAEAQLVEKEIAQRLAGDVADNKRALDEQIRDIEEFTQTAIELADKRHDATVVRVNADIAAYDAAFAKKQISQKEYNLKSRELDLENAEAVQKNADDIWELTNRRNRQIATEELAAHQRSVKLADEASDRIIASIKDRIERELISEVEGERQIAAIEAQGFARRKEALEKELTYIVTTLERKRVINDELISLEGERAQATVDASQRIVDALKREREEFDKRNEAAFGQERPRRVGDATRPRRTEPQDRSAIDQLFEAANENLTGVNQTAAIAGLEALTTAFQGLGQAIGQVVEAWVLYGSAGTSVRKVTAQILAGVAQQAAVKAVFELAEGFAALALSFFGLPNAGPSAAAHFAAAAIYGSIAGIAAVAGRAVAGDAFTKQSAGSGSSSGGRETTQPARRSNEPIDVNRRSSSLATQTLTNEIVFKVKGDALVDTFVQDYNLNGRTRIIIKSDGS